MDLSFDLKTLVAVEITGEVLIVDGIHAPTVLDQMLRQYEDEDIGVCTSAILAFVPVRWASLTLFSARVRPSTSPEPIVSSRKWRCSPMTCCGKKEQASGPPQLSMP
jgi:hypothetical protein